MLMLLLPLDLVRIAGCVRLAALALAAAAAAAAAVGAVVGPTSALVAVGDINAGAGAPPRAVAVAVCELGAFFVDAWGAFRRPA